MKNNYILSWHDSARNTGGVKAKSDVVYFLSKNGVIPVDTPSDKFGKIITSIFAKQRLSKLNGSLLIQYPSGKNLIRNLWMKAAMSNKKLKVILLVHDLEVLRFHNDNNHLEEKRKEIQFLNQADGLIVLNSKMQGLLSETGITIPMVSLRIWDYDNPQPFNDEFRYNKTICYAGNLTKSMFLKSLNLSNKLHVFGPNANFTLPKSVIYEGEYTPQELPKMMNFNFGLIWDGISTKTCSGSYGQYLRFNDPHKTSLYLSTGLPVIVWKHAAIADFILRNKVGKTVGNLNELDHLLDSISEAEFTNMKKNAITIGRKMRQGFYINSAYSKLKNELGL